jgi:hypothetical protein
MSEKPDFASHAGGRGECDDAVEAVAFTHALHRAADALPSTDRLALVSAGYARGRVLRRRRAAVVTAGAAVLALVGAGGVLAAVGGHGARGVGAAQSPSRAVTGAHTVGTAAGSRPMSARQVEDLLISMLPPGSVSGRYGRGTDDELGPLAHVVYDDGQGASAIEVAVRSESGAPIDCADARAAGDWCRQTHVYGGVLTIVKGWEYPDHRVDTKDWTAEFRAKDGSLVSVSEWNAPAEKGAPVTRPEPPLSAAQLGAIATDHKWRRVLAATRGTVVDNPARSSSDEGRRGGQTVLEV